VGDHLTVKEDSSSEQGEKETSEEEEEEFITSCNWRLAVASSRRRPTLEVERKTLAARTPPLDLKSGWSGLPHESLLQRFMENTLRVIVAHCQMSDCELIRHLVCDVKGGGADDMAMSWLQT
jgi:hypothetical protein